MGLSSERVDLTDRYLWLLCGCLAGYALLGKAFAYIGYSSVYVGEVCLALGMLILFRSGSWIAALASFPSIALAALLLLVAFLTASDFGNYGLQAVRDSVVVLYA